MSFSFTDNAVTKYVRESQAELKRVVWPSRKTVVKHTLLVVGVSICMGAFFGAIDFGLNIALQTYLNK